MAAVDCVCSWEEAKQKQAELKQLDEPGAVGRLEAQREALQAMSYEQVLCAPCVLCLR